MSKYDFSVQTPQEWKENLYAKTNRLGRKRMKPVALLAAVLAVLIGLSGTAFAGRVINAPEYFGSVFLGNTPEAGEVYSEKNTVFTSNREDLQMICTGIVGDKVSLYLIFRITSTGDLLFDADYIYLFDINDHEAGFFPSMGKGVGCTVLDDRTLEMHVDMMGISGGSFVGKKVGFLFENLEKYISGGDFSDMEVIPCRFEGEITVDYTNTVKKLGATENELTVNGITMKPKKAEISNMHLCYDMKIVQGAEILEPQLIELVNGTLTLTFADGSIKNYDLQHPPADDNDVFAATVSLVGDELQFILNFPALIRAADIKTVAIDDIVLFAK